KTELAQGAIAPIAVTGHPELQAVALAPVRLLGPAGGGIGRVGSGDVNPGGLGDPAFREYGLTLPHTSLQVQLTKPGNGFGGGKQAGETDIPAGRMGLP